MVQSNVYPPSLLPLPLPLPISNFKLIIAANRDEHFHRTALPLSQLNGASSDQIPPEKQPVYLPYGA